MSLMLQPKYQKLQAKEGSPIPILVTTTTPKSQHGETATITPSAGEKLQGPVQGGNKEIILAE